MVDKNEKKIEIYELDRGVIKSLAGFNFKVKDGADYRVCHISIEVDLVIWGTATVLLANSLGSQTLISTDSFSEMVLH